MRTCVNSIHTHNGGLPIRLVYTEEENKSLKTELSELRARHKIELERVQKEKEKEMEQVHER